MLYAVYGLPARLDRRESRENEGYYIMDFNYIEMGLHAINTYINVCFIGFVVYLLFFIEDFIVGNSQLPGNKCIYLSLYFNIFFT